jgi:hypothetical protein
MFFANRAVCRQLMGPSALGKAETHQDGMDIQPILVLHLLYSLFDDLLVLREEHLLLNDNLIGGDIMGSEGDRLDPRKVIRVDVDFNARILELFK